jgi:hypothetical protein
MVAYCSDVIRVCGPRGVRTSQHSTRVDSRVCHGDVAVGSLRQCRDTNPTVSPMSSRLTEAATQCIHVKAVQNTIVIYSSQNSKQNTGVSEVHGKCCSSRNIYHLTLCSYLQSRLQCNILLQHNKGNHIQQVRELSFLTQDQKFVPHKVSALTAKTAFRSSGITHETGFCTETLPCTYLIRAALLWNVSINPLNPNGNYMYQPL